MHKIWLNNEYISYQVFISNSTSAYLINLRFLFSKNEIYKRTFKIEQKLYLAFPVAKIQQNPGIS